MAQLLKSKTKLQFPNDFLRGVPFTDFIWKECATPHLLISECEKIML